MTNAWAERDRRAFWETVRLSMAAHRVDQATLADALSMDRANLSRRLAGRVAERPSLVQIDALVEALRLDPSSKAALLRLAGYALSEPTDGLAPEAEKTRPTSAAATYASTRPGESSHRRWRSGLFLGMAVLALVAAILVALPSDRLTNSASAHIVTPPDGSHLHLGWIDMDGTAYVPAPDSQHLWIVEQLAGYYWPQQQAVLRRNTWSAQARLGAGSSDIGKRLDLLIVLAPSPADQELRAWLERGGATGEYTPMRGLPDGARVLDQVTVTIAP